MSYDELSNYIDELNSESADDYAMEQAIKLIINSIYGAFANEYFHFYNVDIAESITLQGQEAIKFSEEITEDYFEKDWHKDKECHEAMGITEEVKPLKSSVWQYTDTDSGYVVFDEVLKSCGYDYSKGKEFILSFNEHRFKPFLNKAFDDYSKGYNTENFLNFELETIAANAIWCAKKKYVQNIIWKDGVNYEFNKYLKVTGLAIIQSSTPTFCRGRLKELVSWIFKEGDNFKIDELLREIKKIKKQFKLANLDDICLNSGISNYQKGVADDQDAFELNSGCPIHVRAGAYHNYLLNNSDYKMKYQLITSGDKIKYYFTRDDDFNNNFGFLAGKHPYEIAPQIDYETQFEKSFLDKLNALIVPMGFKRLDRNLIFTMPLF